MVEDKILISRCKRGNRAAFCRIYEKYEGDLRTLAANLLDDKTEAEDVVHDVFISFLQAVKNFELKSNLKGFLMTCVANKARDYARKKHRQKTVTSDDVERAASDTEGPLQLIERNDRIRKLNRAMTSLPYEKREAIVLYLHGRMKFKTIAKLQNVSTKTAHSRYRLGLERLKSILDGKV